MRRFAPLAALLAALSLPAVAADADAPHRSTISLRAGGKEVAGVIAMPGQRNVQFDALKTEHLPDGSLHLSGHVQLTLRMENAATLKLYGDDLVLHTDVLDADEARAIDDIRQMGISDQAVRANIANLSEADKQRMTEVDAANMKRLAQIVDRYGWPGMRFAGDYAHGAFLVLQHADLDSQHTYLPLLRAAMARGDVPAADLAALEDRVLKGDHQPQLYGTQFETTRAHEALKLYTVADPARLDERRLAVGLGPMEDYLAWMRTTYQAD